MEEILLEEIMNKQISPPPFSCLWVVLGVVREPLGGVLLVTSETILIILSEVRKETKRSRIHSPHSEDQIDSYNHLAIRSYPFDSMRGRVEIEITMRDQAKYP